MPNDKLRGQNWADKTVARIRCVAWFCRLYYKKSSSDFRDERVCQMKCLSSVTFQRQHYRIESTFKNKNLWNMHTKKVKIISSKVCVFEPPVETEFPLCNIFPQNETLLSGICRPTHIIFPHHYIIHNVCYMFITRFTQNCFQLPVKYRGLFLELAADGPVLMETSLYFSVQFFIIIKPSKYDRSDP